MWCSLALCLMWLASITTAQPQPSNKAIMSLTMCDAQLTDMKRGYKIRKSTVETNRRAEAATRRRGGNLRRTAAQGVAQGSVQVLVQGAAQGSAPGPLPCNDNIQIDNRIFRSANGRCNNLANPGYGESFEKFRRFVDVRYEDDMCLVRTTGVNGERLPNPRIVSRAIHPDVQSFEDLSVLIMQWGQFMDHDMTAAAVEQPADNQLCCSNPIFQAGNPHPDETMCGGACLPIRVTDAGINTQCMENVRSRSILDINDISATNKREQQNLLTAFIDASNVYGSEEERISELRNGSTPFMRMSANNLLPEGLPTDCILSANAPFCFAAGDERVHVFAGLTGLHTVFVRLHNKIAKILRGNTPWSNDRVFYETRKIIGALLQEITYFRWLPCILNKKTRKQFGLLRNQYKRKGYNPSIDPSISNAFATAAFRFGHSLIPSNLTLDGKVELTREIFNNPKFIFANNGQGLLHVMKAVISQPALERDRFLTKEVTDHLFETPTAVFDLASLNILRGRDHGIGTYNDARKACNLPQITSFSIFGEAAQAFQNTYKSVDDIDLFAGGMSEPNLPGAGLGETFSCILGDQFKSLRYGDRFWYETRDKGIRFTAAQRRSIQYYTIDKILCDTLDLKLVTQDPFLLPDRRRNRKRPCSRQLNLRRILRPWTQRNQG